ncbi:MAG: ATP-binding protein [Paludibacteraceae bacterium]|nr:ATP-binding protein [Paludibacteraceae bacterium]
MINRALDKYIENHFATSKSALLLKGARQTGKTYAIRKYAQKHNMNLIEINFYEDKDARTLFDGANSAKEVLLRISAHTRKKTSLPDTLIFFDEVQTCPNIITWIKFLVDEGSCKYALSGSLLGIELENIESVPVGYMAVKEVFPLDMEEFALCVGISNEVIESIEMAYKNQMPVDTIVHESMLKVVRLYMIVGGMPAVVQSYIDTNDLNVVEEKQYEILELYKMDISKYDPDSKLAINEIFNQIPSELNAKNKRFVLKNLNEHARFLKYQEGFVWLKNAGVAIPTLNVTEPRMPLKLNEQRNLFKLFQNDVGLLACQYALGIQLKLLKDEVTINYGAIYENLVAQELMCHGFGGDDHSLYYFNSKKQGELDFIISQGESVIPIEVKSGKDYNRHNAIANIMDNDEYDIKSAYIFCNSNVEIKDKKIYMPIYMLMFIRKRPHADKQIYKLPLMN